MCGGMGVEREESAEQCVAAAADRERKTVRVGETRHRFNRRGASVCVSVLPCLLALPSQLSPASVASSLLREGPKGRRC